MKPLQPSSGLQSIKIQSFSFAIDGALDIVVVIDVFRAFSVAALALANGAGRIIMVDDVQQALALRDQNLGRYCLGERGGNKPPGFDFGNSPAELQNVRFCGETLIQTTSNGTRGILAAKNARRIYAGSLMTAQATANAIKNHNNANVMLVPMGDKEIVRTDEDEICALYLRALLEGRKPNVAAVRQTIETMSPRMDSITMSSPDIDCCLRINSIPLAVSVQLEDDLLIATACA